MNILVDVIPQIYPIISVVEVGNIVQASLRDVLGQTEGAVGQRGGCTPQQLWQCLATYPCVLKGSHL